MEGLYHASIAGSVSKGFLGDQRSRRRPCCERCRCHQHCLQHRHDAQDRSRLLSPDRRSRRVVGIRRRAIPRRHHTIPAPEQSRDCELRVRFETHTDRASRRMRSRIEAASFLSQQLSPALDTCASQVACTRQSGSSGSIRGFICGGRTFAELHAPLQ
jgi:hypothetical protein